MNTTSSFRLHARPAVGRFHQVLASAALLLAAATPAQDWDPRIQQRWPGTAVAKVDEAGFLQFVKELGATDTKAAWQAFVAAQHRALGLPLPVAAGALRGTWSEVPTAVGDGFFAEVEPNDGSAQANPIAAEDHVEASLSAGDVDWFVFTVPAASLMTLYTNPGPGGTVTDTVLELYDAGLALLAVNDDSRGFLSTLRGNIQPGTYFARVRHFAANGTGAYSLDLSLGSVNPPVPEAAEPNATPATATAFGAGFGEGRVLAAGDTDWWSFTVNQTSVVVAETGPQQIGPSLQDSTLALWDAAGTTQIAFDDDTGPGLFARLVVTVPAGTYHLEVGGYQNGVGRYSLRLEQSLAQQVNVAEAAEPNGTAASATPFAPGFTGVGGIGAPLDSDWWAFTITQNSVLAIATRAGTGASPLVDPTLAVRRPDGTLLAFDDDGGPALQAQLFVELAQGTYVLDVRGFQNLTGDYELDLVALAGQNAARATYQVLGGGCPGSNSLVPAWRVRPFEVPLLGTTLVGSFADAPAFTAVVAFAGLSTTISSSGVPLPFSLAPLGAPGCEVAVDPAISLVLITDALGQVPWGITIPYSPVFVSVDVFQQGLVFDPAANALGVAVTNFGRGVIGERLN